MKVVLNNLMMGLLAFVLLSWGGSSTVWAQKKTWTSKSKTPTASRNVAQATDEDDEDFVDRQNADLSQLQSKEVVVEGAVCDACIYKIKSVLQESPEVFKVNHEGLKDLYIYFNKGQSLSDAKIRELVSVAGYKVVEIKPASAQAKTKAQK